MILFLAIFILFLFQMAVTVSLMISYKKKPNEAKNTISEVSIVIPFHNEAQRISGLINSINEVLFPDNLQVEILFIDDNSDDITAEIINKELKKQFKIIKSHKVGKKHAISVGVEAAVYKNIISWDADISFSKEYLYGLKKINIADLIILPVRLKGDKLFQKLNSFEFAWMQLLTFATAAKNSPFLCNGANLFFSKEAYLKADSQRTDANIASGDDLFLLDAVKLNGGNISWCTDDFLTVTTAAPYNRRTLFSQRKRWIGKMKNLMNNQTILGVGFLILLQVGLIACLMGLFISWLFVIPLLLKVITEWMIVQFINKGGKPDHDFLLVVIHQFWYPIYLVSLVFAKIKDDKWNRMLSK